MTDLLVFDDRTHYIGYVEIDGSGAQVGSETRLAPSGWVRWPAHHDGWRYRRAHPAPSDDYRGGALPSRQASLALKLSGATR